MTSQDHDTVEGGRPRVVVVGPCASGKTTLVSNLKAAGVDARVSGQEHSAVRNLWRRLNPDVLVALDVDLDTLRERRDPAWSASLYDVQRGRLAGAFEAADVVIDTSARSEQDVMDLVLGAIATYDLNSG
jgi:GTPase SAR1 family protein